MDFVIAVWMVSLIGIIVVPIVAFLITLVKRKEFVQAFFNAMIACIFQIVFAVCWFAFTPGRP